MTLRTVLLTGIGGVMGVVVLATATAAATGPPMHAAFAQPTDSFGDMRQHHERMKDQLADRLQDEGFTDEQAGNVQVAMENHHKKHLQGGVMNATWRR